MRRHTVIAIVLALLLAPWAAAAAKRYWVYVGTYTGPQSKGIYAFQFDAESGKLEPAVLVGELTRPSFLAIHPNRKYLYAVSELGTSTVTAFEINPKTGMLTLLNTVPAKGSSACHLVVDQTGKTLVVANYGNGSVAVFRVGAGRTPEREYGPGPAQRLRPDAEPATRPPCRTPWSSPRTIASSSCPTSAWIRYSHTAWTPPRPP